MKIPAFFALNHKTIILDLAFFIIGFYLAATYSLFCDCKQPWQANLGLAVLMLAFSHFIFAVIFFATHKFHKHHRQ